MDIDQLDKLDEVYSGRLEGLFCFIRGYTDGLDDLPDGAFWAMHEAAVESHNEEFGTIYDWFDIQADYIQWFNEQEKGLER